MDLDSLALSVAGFFGLFRFVDLLVLSVAVFLVCSDLLVCWFYLLLGFFFVFFLN